ncbi:universal stress protein A [Tamilnaduibacter salinus]|uniref:Universal stress protein n=1 Tax=Tamilnaduibacter salinus TaxID=1484056 RepID=A0A2A2I568_9GAMM|nr:universal stress protein [Tamilnaduibacter salinus]PAV26275.1 universal stress protein UspA [Tamilnaduibacter salinus]PVY78018.1 universal stress protein A [Tamilnaduibacter salinus]
MSHYNRILAAIDLTEEADQVLARAREIADNHDAELLLLHVVEPVGYAYGGDIPMDLSDLQDQLDQAAHEQLAAFGRAHNVSEPNQVVSVGRPESEIHRICKERDVDLAIVGSHGRHGIQLLLGSTANGVLHGAQCDVLAVRIR